MLYGLYCYCNYPITIILVINLVQTIDSSVCIEYHKCQLKISLNGLTDREMTMVSVQFTEKVLHIRGSHS